MTVLRADALLEGAFDIHAHGYPEFTVGMPPRVDNATWARLASDAGMRGFVMKSHIWPTIQTTNTLQELHPELEIYGGVALNPPVGGISPVTAELVIQAGGKIVWMPTWSARQNPPNPSIYYERMKPWIQALDGTYPGYVDGLSVVDASGELTHDTVEIVKICARYSVTLASGHLPIEHTKKLAVAAAEHSVRFILTHPLSGSVGASLEDQLEVVQTGAMIEHVFVGCMPMHQRTDPRLIKDAIVAVGPEHCIMASDAIEAWNPPAPELLRMFMASMLALGVSEDDVHLMTHDNPVRILGLGPTRTRADDA